VEEVLDGGSEEEIAEQGNGGFFKKGKLGFLEIFLFFSSQIAFHWTIN
jgi:hypothetical protein